MSTVNAIRSITLVAAADLSADQYKFVDVDGNGQAVLVSAAGQRSAGVLQNKPGEALGAAGEEATVAFSGAPKAVAGGAITAGQEIKADASGLAVSAATPVTGHYVQGVALTSVASGELVEFLRYVYVQ